VRSEIKDTKMMNPTIERYLELARIKIEECHKALNSANKIRIQGSKGKCIGHTTSRYASQPILVCAKNVFYFDLPCDIVESACISRYYPWYRIEEIKDSVCYELRFSKKDSDMFLCALVPIGLCFDEYDKVICIDGYPDNESNGPLGGLIQEELLPTMKLEFKSTIDSSSYNVYNFVACDTDKDGNARQYHYSSSKDALDFLNSQGKLGSWFTKTLRRLFPK
jgi:hypothetical protein